MACIHIYHDGLLYAFLFNKFFYIYTSFKESEIIAIANIYIYIYIYIRLAVLMVSTSLVLKHETSTLRQSHNFISIDFKFGVSGNVREVTSPAKFGSGLMSGRDAT